VGGKMSNPTMLITKNYPVKLIDVEYYENAFNNLRDDIKIYLSENYFGVESSDLMGQAKIKNRTYLEKLALFHKHKESLGGICGNKSPRGRYDPTMYFRSVDYLVNVMEGLM
jgi:hypothetical protein